MTKERIQRTRTTHWNPNPNLHLNLNLVLNPTTHNEQRTQNTGCYVLIDVYQIVFVTWRKIFVQCHLLTVLSTLGRAFLKVVAFGWLYTNYPDDIFINSARCVRAKQDFGQLPGHG